MTRPLREEFFCGFPYVNWKISNTKAEYWEQILKNQENYETRISPRILLFPVGTFLVGQIGRKKQNLLPIGRNKFFIKETKIFLMKFLFRRFLVF